MVSNWLYGRSSARVECRGRAVRIRQAFEHVLGARLAQCLAFLGLESAEGNEGLLEVLLQRLLLQLKASMMIPPLLVRTSWTW